jgi:hypothetical protein
LLLVAFTSPVVVFLRRKHLPANFLSLYVFLILGCCFWLVQAPDPRFAYSYVIPLFLITLILCIPYLQHSLYVLTISSLALLLFETGTVLLHLRLKKTFIKEGMIVSTSDNTMFFPAPYTQQAVSTYEKPFHLYVPLKTELCWDTPLPCADHLPENVRMRGTSLGEGFMNVVRNQ